MKCSNNVQCFHAVFLARALHILIKILENCPISYVGIMLDAFASLLCLKLCRHNLAQAYTYLLLTRNAKCSICNDHKLFKHHNEDSL